MPLWLHDMGFSYKQFSKGVYFDGHEREDVVEERKAYLAELASYSQEDVDLPFPSPQLKNLPIFRKHFNTFLKAMSVIPSLVFILGHNVF